MASVSTPCEHNASMELIPGMDKLLNHMKEQDKKIKELKEHIDKLEEGNKKRFDKIKGLEYELKQEKEKKPDKPIVIKDSDIKRANKNLSKQLETEKDKVNQVLTALECWKEENKKLKEWSLSTQMIEDTSAETIEEFERDVRDNWKENTEFTEEIDELKEKITCLESDSHNEVSQAEHEEQMENTLASLNFYKECNEELKKTITRLQKERNYLGDYEGGATSESEEEEDEYPETLSSIDKQKFMTVFTNEDSYRIYEKDEDVAIRQGDNVRGRLIFNGEGDPDSVKFIIDSDYEMKEGEGSVQYWE